MSGHIHIQGQRFVSPYPASFSSSIETLKDTEGLTLSICASFTLFLRVALLDRPASEFVFFLFGAFTIDHSSILKTHLQ
jgi:hypothetical protein